MANRTLMRSQKPTLQQRNNQMRYLQVLALCYLMKVAGRFQVAISCPVVRSYCTALLNTPLHERGETGRRCIWNDTQTNAAYFLFTLIFNGYSNQGFSFSSAPSLALFLSSNVGFVNFNPYRKAITDRSYHRAPQFMEPDPGCFVAAEFKNPLYVFGASAILLAGHPPYCTKPKNQRFSSPLKNCSRSNRALVAARGTAKQITTCLPRFFMVTTRTTESIRPAQLKKVFTASLIGGEPLFQFL